MRKAKLFLIFAIGLLCVVISTPYALADPVLLGYETPFGWAGSGARINGYIPDYYNYSSDISNIANDPTSTNYSSGMMSGWAESSAYVLKGSISSGETTERQAGGYFRDELYFATYNGQPAELALTFSVHAEGYVNEKGDWVYNPVTDEDEWVPNGSGSAWLNLGMNVPLDTTPTGWHYLSNNFIVYNTTPGAIDVNSEVTLSSLDGNFLIQSGTYLPFTVGLWGTVDDAWLDWANTVELILVQAFQNGEELDETQFTILSKNDERYFDDFDHGSEPTNPVPIPAAVWLFGTGLLGLFGVRRKMRK